MPAWILNLLKPLFEFIMSIGINQVLGLIKDYLDEKNAKKAEKTKQDEAQKDLKQELEKAGNDEKAQEDAIDKFFSRTR